MLRIHHFEPASRANGPGLRAVLWVQGCGLACPGCFNPETHSFEAGLRWTVEETQQKILSVPNIQGLTISGGEPLAQHRALAQVLAGVRASSNLSVLVFTGYTWEELQTFPRIEAFLAHVDVLIAGRYDATHRLANGLIGSSNKTVHFLTSRYTPADLAHVPQAEIILSPTGEIILSGINPLQWEE